MHLPVVPAWCSCIQDGCTIITTAYSLGRIVLTCQGCTLLANRAVVLVFIWPFNGIKFFHATSVVVTITPTMFRLVAL